VSNGGEIECGRYRHTKSSQEYEVIGVALDTETEVEMVIYRPLYESERSMFARPLAMFEESVVINGIMQKRFQKIEKS